MGRFPHHASGLTFGLLLSLVTMTHEPAAGEAVGFEVRTTAASHFSWLRTR